MIPVSIVTTRVPIWIAVEFPVELEAARLLSCVCEESCELFLAGIIKRSILVLVTEPWELRGSLNETLVGIHTGSPGEKLVPLGLSEEALNSLNVSLVIHID